MSSAFNSLMKSLQEVDEHLSGKRQLSKKIVTIEPVKEYSSSEVKRLREKSALSQRLFAEVMGVSIKTVEAWECGRNHPSGAARRVLSVLEKDNDFLRKEKILIEG